MHIDLWTLALQAVNVLVLIWILKRFLFKPVMAMVERRQAAIRQTLDSAEAARAEAEKSQQAVEARLAAIKTEADEILVSAQKAAAERAFAAEAEAVSAIEEKKRAAEALLQADRRAAGGVLAQTAADLAEQMALRLLARIPPETGFAVFLEGLARGLTEADPMLRAELAAAAQVSPGLEVRTPMPLEEAARESCRARIEAVLGPAPYLHFTTKPGLLAGVELHGPHGSLHNSWGADMETMRAEMARRVEPA